MDLSQKDLLLVLVLCLVGLAFIWVPLQGGIPLFLLSYLLLLVLPGYTLILFLKPGMSLPSRLICGFFLSLALLVGIFFIIILLELYIIIDYLPSFLLVFSILVASAHYLRSRSVPEKDKGQLTLYESIERAQRVRNIVNEDNKVPEEPLELEPAEKEPAITEVYQKLDYISPKEVEDHPPEPAREAPKMVREDVKPLRDEHLQNGFEDKKPKPEVSHPLWRQDVPAEEGFCCWDLFVVILLTALTLAFLNMDLFINPLHTSLLAYLSMLFLFGYVLVVVIYPVPKRIRIGSRLVASIIIGILIFAATFLLYTLNLLSFIPAPFFYAIAILIVLVVFVAIFRRKTAVKELEKEEEPPYEDILIDHDQEAIKAREEAEALPEEEPVIIPEHVILQEEEPDEDIETIIPEIVALKQVLEEDEVLSQDQTPHREEEVNPPLKDEDVEAIIPEIVDLKHVLQEDENLPMEEPLAEDEVEVIIPEHTASQAEEEISQKKESTLKTDKTESKIMPEEPYEPEKQSITPETKAETLEVTKEAPMKSEETPQNLETPSEEKPGMVFPWIERQKEKSSPHVYEDKPHPIIPKRIRSTRPTDLILVVILTLLTASFVLIPTLNETPIKYVLGTLLVIFVSGYSLIAVIFPHRDDLDNIERVALSFGLSIAITPLIALTLYYTPWGINLDPILISLTGFTLSLCLIAFIRRHRLSNNEKFGLTFGQLFQEGPRKNRILKFILILVILLAISLVAFLVMQSIDNNKFTEFYLLGPDGKASNYPTNLTLEQNATVIVGVVNRESATTSYKLIIRVNDTIIKMQDFTLQDKEEKKITVNFIDNMTGRKKMDFLLFKAPDYNNFYRDLQLWYQVS